jgi:hypothetical protein
MLSYERFVVVLSMGAVLLLTTGVNRCQKSYSFAAQSKVPTATPTGEDDGLTTRTPGSTLTALATRTGSTTPATTQTAGSGTPTAIATATETENPDLAPLSVADDASFQISKKQASGAALLGALSQLEKDEDESNQNPAPVANQPAQKGAAGEQNWLGKGFNKQDGNADTDGDSYSDLREEQFNTDPNDPTSYPPVKISTELAARLKSVDDDADGIPSAQEKVLGSDPFNADSDGDGVSDGAEIRSGTDPIKTQSLPADSDGDGLSDQYEKSRGLDWQNADGDGDGLRDDTELALGTDITKPDSDGDGIADGKEVAIGSDPIIAEN